MASVGQHGSNGEVDGCMTQVIESVVRRRSSGEAVGDAEVMDAHPELMPELGERLRVLALLDHAEEKADRPPPSTTP